MDYYPDRVEVVGGECECGCGHVFDYLIKCPRCGSTEWHTHVVHSFHGPWDYLAVQCNVCRMQYSFRLGEKK